MAAIRTQNEIDQIINRAQHTIATLGLEIVNEEKQGITNTTSSHRDKVYRLLLLRIYLQNLLDEYGVIYAYHTANQLRLNQMLDAVVKLSKVLDGPAIPFLGSINLPLYYYPSSAGFNNGTGGGGQATPGGTTFSNSNVDAPGELVDAWNASDSTFAFYIYNVIGSNPGEGSRSGFLVFTIRGNDITMSDAGNTSVGGSTLGVSFSAAINSGVFELTCNVPSDNWIVKGTRILFSNISFQNVQGPLPAGGTTNQFLVKSSNIDYEVDWLTLLWQHITDVTPTLTEINRVSGVTSPIQTQLNALTTAINSLTTALNNYLLLSGGTMSGNIAMGNNRITGLAAAIATGQALRYEQLIGQYLLLSGSSIMAGALNMGGFNVFNLGTPVNPNDAVSLTYLQSAIAAAIPPFVDINIGSWNMAGGGSKAVPHSFGSNFVKIRAVEVIIFNDAGDNVYTLEAYNSTNNVISGGVLRIDSSSVFLYVGTSPGNTFNGGGFTGGGNRGVVRIYYIP